MPFTRVDPDDDLGVAQAAELLNAARAVDDPAEPEHLPVLLSRALRYGWDLEPEEMFLYVPAGTSHPVGLLTLALPLRDNRHLLWTEIVVHPDHRRRGHGSAMLAEAISRCEAAGRTTVWVAAGEEDLGAKAFVERFGFRQGSHDARRHQRVAEVDHSAIERLHRKALAAAADYTLERGRPPIPDEVLEELVEVTAAINDAPMGDLTYEDERFDLQRLRDIEAARVGRQDEIYRIWARHRVTGAIGGHTVVATNRLQPHLGHQGDTAVSRTHRGHRLGVLLKIEMMRWLAEEEPQLEEIITWNQADNHHMVDVNEALGYRLSRVFAMYELVLPATPLSEEPVASALASTIGS